MLNAERKKKVQLQGTQRYMSFKELKEQFGDENAKYLRKEKKAHQMQHGDFTDGYPYWFKHPDLQDVEEQTASTC